MSVRRDVGNCDGSSFIETVEQCAAAAVELELDDIVPDDLSRLGNEKTRLPHGCYWKDDWFFMQRPRLFFNPNGNRQNDDKNRFSLCSKPLSAFHAPTRSPELAGSAMTRPLYGHQCAAKLTQPVAKPFFRSFRLKFTDNPPTDTSHSPGSPGNPYKPYRPGNRLGEVPMCPMTGLAPKFFG